MDGQKMNGFKFVGIAGIVALVVTFVVSIIIALAMVDTLTKMFPPGLDIVVMLTVGYWIFCSAFTTYRLANKLGIKIYTKEPPLLTPLKQNPHTPK